MAAPVPGLPTVTQPSRQRTLALTVLAPVAAAQAPAPSLFQDFRWRNIGPANMAGRVTDIEAVEANPSIVYVAAASGGLWKSVNAGTTWTPVLEQAGTAAMGDVAIFQFDHAVRRGEIAIVVRDR